MRIMICIICIVTLLNFIKLLNNDIQNMYFVVVVVVVVYSTIASRWQYSIVNKPKKKCGHNFMIKRVKSKEKILTIATNSIYFIQHSIHFM